MAGPDLYTMWIITSKVYDGDKRNQAVGHGFSNGDVGSMKEKEMDTQDSELTVC